jgi:hypothetical protein
LLAIPAQQTAGLQPAALIRMRGHPYILAQPYRPGRYLLIGPSVLPQYWQALRTTLTIAFLVIVVLSGALTVGGTPPTVVASVTDG